MSMTITGIDSLNKIQSYNINRQEKKDYSKDTKIKVISAFGSTLGIGCAMASIIKTKHLNIKHDSLRNVFQNLKNVELSSGDVIELATSSIAGGFVAGSAVDPNNTKSKAKEGIMQLIGNYIIPSIFVSAGINLNKNVNSHFSKFPKSGFAKFLFGIVSLTLGVLAGNSVSKKVNEKVFQEKSYRPLKPSDWGMQLDNVCLVTSVANAGTSLAKQVSKIIPIAHLLPGYLTGIKIETEKVGNAFK